MRLSTHQHSTTFECVGLPSIPTLHLFREDGSLKSLEEIEFEVIRFHIEHNGGQMSQVARTLDIGRSTLYRKIRHMECSQRALNNHIG